MASCNYSEFVGGPCGPSVTNPEKDIGGHLHLRSLQVRDSSLDSEGRLLLARAGQFIYMDNKPNLKNNKMKMSTLTAGWKRAKLHASGIYIQ